MKQLFTYKMNLFIKKGSFYDIVIIVLVHGCFNHA